MATARPPDRVDDAIAAAARPAPQQDFEMAQLEGKLATGRPVMIAVPVDVTDFELLNLVGLVLHVGDQLRARRPGSRIVIPR